MSTIPNTYAEAQARGITYPAITEVTTAGEFEVTIHHRKGPLSPSLNPSPILGPSGRWLAAEAGKLASNFDELETVFGIDTTLKEDQTAIFFAVLGEVTPDHYAGSRPPMASYETTILGNELFAFRWTSQFFGGREMYFKFCLTGHKEGRRAFICSVHEHRENQDE